MNVSTQGLIERLTYAYDAAGNRISFSRSGPQADLPQAVTAAYDAANEQVQFNSSTPNLTYDANGNLTSKTDASGTTIYTWDARNRLTSVSGPSVSASFVYDALGRRTSKIINGITIDYQYDGNDIVAEIGGSVVSATYLRSLNIDEPFVRQSSNNEYYHTDALGSVLALTDQTGAMQTNYRYDPFGNTTMTGSSTNVFQFSGRESDGTGLYYLRARYYSPTLQRFISEDPIGLLGGDVNFYAYVRNNPINGIDLLGLAAGDFWDVRTYLPDLEGARRIAEEVGRKEAPATGLPGAHNGPQDAWRHAEWNQRMVEEIGQGTALIASYGHELEEIFDQPFNELLMDLHNNREGRRIANTGKTPMDLLDEGRLRTINPPNTGCPTSGRKDSGQSSYCSGSFY